ncbi:histidine kinase [Paenibacillus sp. KS-LC4]|uniref:sensor histidine kinase n=1 Tax=Paenibacillus sp. KS-LC4 TaxID=2979727 RepID=UPI0030CB2C09
MRLRHPFFYRTLRFKLLFGFLLLVIPIVSFMIYNNLYAINVVRNQVAQSNKNLISLYMGQIDRNLEDVEKYLFNIAAMETGLLVLEQPREQNPDSYLFEKIQLRNQLSNELPNYKWMDMFFIYSPRNDDLMSVFGVAPDYVTRTEMEKDIVDNIKLAKKPLQKDWFVQHMADSDYLVNVIQYGDIYIGAMGNVDQLMVPLHLIDLGEKGRAFLTDDRMKPIIDTPLDSEIIIEPSSSDNEGYQLTGRNDQFIAVGERSSRGRFGLVALIPDSVVLEKLPFLRSIVSLISFGAIIILPIILLLLRKLVLVPVNRIIMAMRRIEAGNMDMRITKPSSTFEFEVMNESFNRMITQIQELKVNVLEEQLNYKKAQLKHLQLQINPHFFLNSLNIVYNLAQVKDYHLIQEMTHCLVQYFRFMFRSNLSFVSLSDELAHTMNYLRIQEMRFPGDLTFAFHTDESLGKIPIPPLVIQTFVENTIKHAVNTDTQVHIGVTAQAHNEDTLYVRIEDNGEGFPPQVLALLQRDMELNNEEGDHIGIQNVKQRLGLLYHDAARMALSGSSGLGAVVELWLPMQPEETGGRRE